MRRSYRGQEITAAYTSQPAGCCVVHKEKEKYQNESSEEDAGKVLVIGLYAG